MTTSSKFKQKVQDGKKGLNRGLSGGLPNVDKITGNIQLGKIHSIIGNPGSGKSFLMLYRYVICPWISGERNIKWFFYSLEMSEEDVIARLASYFIHKKYGIRLSSKEIFSYGEYRLSSDYQNKVNYVIGEYIDPLLEHLEIITDKRESNPTGINKRLTDYADQIGNIEWDRWGPGRNDKRFKSYKPKDRHHKVICLIDHLGLMKRESGKTKKDNIDHWLEQYAINLTTNYNFTIVNLNQLNRNIQSVERIKFSKEDLQPNSSDIKDSSALHESSDIILAIFNPNDFKHLKNHWGYDLVDWRGLYRSIHVIKSRYCPFPLQTAVALDAKTCSFIELPPPNLLEELEEYKNKIQLI